MQEVPAKGEVYERALVLVKHSVHLVHVGKAIIILSAQCKFAEIMEARHTLVSKCQQLHVCHQCWSG